MAYEEFKEKIVKLQSDVALFKTEFLDRDEFRKFANDLHSNIDSWHELCITGYFSETIRKSLERIISFPHFKVRLVCPPLNPRNTRDRKNLQILRKLARAGVQVKINDRLHARFLVAYNRVQGHASLKYWGMVLIGSFDFNMECIGRERYDAGIKTRNPDLVNSAVELFEQIWSEQESKSLEEFGGN